jgi:hydroxymethylglutaryl-CoA synthase
MEDEVPENMRTERGIVAYGAYLPYHRLERSAISAALGTPPARGTRTVASYDEDTTSMGVEAARAALSDFEGPIDALYFATADPAYLDKTNAAAIHAALGLEPAVGAYDMVGSVRSGMGALRAGANGKGAVLVVCSDIRTGLPGGADERDGGDGAVAFVLADHGARARLLGWASATEEFLERWRLPGERASHTWEERFGEHAYVPLAEAALTEALKQAGLGPDAIDHLVVTGEHARAARRVAAAAGARSEAAVDDRTAEIGNLGTAHPGLLLADVLDRAAPDQVIALVTLADGADAALWRTTDAVAEGRAAREEKGATVAGLVASGKVGLPYATFLTWRGMLEREPPRRPDPDVPAAPVALRSEPWKFGFVASRCTACGTRHLPPQQVCVHCHAVGQMAPERMADATGTIATFTIDHLAYSLSPPVVAAVVNFDGGGRFQCELTDVDPDAVRIGERVEMTFRRVYTARGVHNYFWKARPLRTVPGRQGR